MDGALPSIPDLLEALDLDYTTDTEGIWTQVPSERRGSVAVQLAARERTLGLRAFVMRAPDLRHEDVYRRLLRKNHDGGPWAFSLDPLGDVFAVASQPLVSIDAQALDGLLGGLAMLVDEVFEGIVRTGFDYPPDLPVGPPPGR
jgi:hypothetical protein